MHLHRMIASEIPRELSLVSERIRDFATTAAEVEQHLRKRAETLPDESSVETLTGAFWDIWKALAESLDNSPSFAADQMAVHRGRELVRYALLSVLARSRYFWRSMVAPHGYSGDYQMLEWMYDLETSAGKDQRQPAFVNALDRVYASIDSVQSVWERRRWLREAVSHHIEATKDAVILDVACGGARYLSDALEHTEARPAKIIIVDQDPSALHHASIALGKWYELLEIRCMPLKAVGAFLAGPEKPRPTLAISAGLFDYLDAATGRELLGLLRRSELLITNFHREDRSRLPKEWGAGWDIVYRDEAEVVSLFPEDMSVSRHRSKNGSLVMAHARPS